MENSFCQKNIFKSGLDSFEFDDEFLLEIDSKVKKNGNNLGSMKDAEEKAKNYFNSSLNFENLNDSDFLNCNIRTDTQISSKTSQCHNIKSKAGNERLKNKFVGCLSPIQGALPTNEQNQSFTSTPLRKDLKAVEKNLKNTDYNYIEADLFEDWDNEDFNVGERQKDEDDLITLSQAFQMIEKAKKSKEEESNLNKSVDLLTGEVVQPEDLLSYGKDKPPAAQKLNFGTDIDPPRIADDTDLKNICLSSDEDFDVFTQVRSVEADAVKTSKEHNTIELSDGSIDLVTKRNKKLRIIESDSTDSPSPKFRRKLKKKKYNDSQGRRFLNSEAEVSDEVEVSSDEVVDEVDEYEKSFLDENSYCTQNCLEDMTCKYLESVKTVGGRPDGFKIPKAKPYIPDDVFSQMPEEPNTDYEMDSFCVNDVEEEITDLSDLEIAEKILEMDRKKKKKKRGRQHLRGIK